MRGLNRDWPTMVSESGLSESPNRLRIDVGWWLIESGGQVKIALLISLKPALSAVHFEIWELDLAQRLMTRAVANNVHHPQQLPTCVQAIDIEHNKVSGTPLILEFWKDFPPRFVASRIRRFLHDTSSHRVSKCSVGSNLVRGWIIRLEYGFLKGTVTERAYQVMKPDRLLVFTSEMKDSGRVFNS